MAIHTMDQFNKWLDIIYGQASNPISKIGRDKHFQLYGNGIESHAKYLADPVRQYTPRPRIMSKEEYRRSDRVSAIILGSTLTPEEYGYR